MPNLHFPITYKTESELKVMEEGGKKLAGVKEELRLLIKEGVSAAQIEELATSLIRKVGGKPSFKMVPGYFWTTCVNINEGVVHGIPKSEIVLKNNDLVSVDLGMFYQGYHTDTSFSCVIGGDAELKEFLKVGEEALSQAIKKVVVGDRVFDISLAIQKTIEAANLSPVRSLVGHGIGRALHEEPEIPCFTQTVKEKTAQIKPGMTLAIEVMYTRGTGEIEISRDGWTITTADGKIAALFEETVAVTAKETKVLTA